MTAERPQAHPLDSDPSARAGAHKSACTVRLPTADIRF